MFEIFLVDPLCADRYIYGVEITVLLFWQYVFHPAVHPDGNAHAQDAVDLGIQDVFGQPVIGYAGTQ